MHAIARRIGFYILTAIAAVTVDFFIPRVMPGNPVDAVLAKMQGTVVTQATLWFVTTSVAFYCIRRRNFQQHRQWMIRSYAITLIFVTDRVLDAIPGLADLDTDASPNIVWLSNIIAWVVPTFIISWQNIIQSPTDTRVDTPVALTVVATPSLP